MFIIVIPFWASRLPDRRARRDARATAQPGQTATTGPDSYVKQTAGGSASEIAKAKELLDAGTITQEEFDSIKAKALAAKAMLRRIADMPVGTLGFEAIGEVEDDDWEEAVEPLLREEIAAGRRSACSTCSVPRPANSRATR